MTKQIVTSSNFAKDLTNRQERTNGHEL